MASVTIMIPTQRRLGGLAVAARSVLAQTGVDHSELELVIVDNDQVPSARDVAQTLAAEAPFPVHYVHEPRAGVANARNAGMAKASGEFVAFLDDDEEAPTGWLAALLAAQQAYAADVVFGPVRARAPEAVTSHRDYLERFFSRIGPGQAGVIDHYYGCGDSLLKRASLPDPVAPFAAERNHIGGEDDMLFGHMRAAGAVFAWEPAAWVWEDPVPDRLTLDYTIRRAFAYGQGPSAHCAAAVPPDRVGVARWMAVGVVQAALFGAVAGFKWLTRAGDRAEWLDRAARGLGKTLWWGPFKIHFYGHSA
ncbi:glycosyltransferase family 2 protein [Caulobacter endophyticus]|uniref:Glycosyltransferase family 2 protein n=1 Tax=Caulobacter endophyticus TaxID=2172652 RepID=A0A2T9KAI6_9CAUL|nr:glycosyltransferase family 2 protein [Caulobacter endophyticus]PVM92984.1 glycosyltransferase family 2 protein [Caulobacter endophyticus]